MSKASNAPELVILYEHPELQKPLFSALEAAGVPFATFDLKRASFSADDLPAGRVFFNQASPSAYVRGNTRAVPLAYSLMRSLEIDGRKVLNGSRAFALELSKTAQASLLRKLGLRTPKTRTFNAIEAVADTWKLWPALLKPEQGGSGARMFLLENFAELEKTLSLNPETWQPDNLLLMQEYFAVDKARGIVRMEFVGGKFLYAMRVVSHGAFNLCAIPARTAEPVKPVEFFPYLDVPKEAVAEGERIMAEGGLDVGGIEYLESSAGERVYYDINANSNLRAPIAEAFGFNPFERVVAYLKSQL
jgi:glutathione synthase/RimK-type ligase-like ATP-grasp enzyme